MGGGTSSTIDEARARLEKARQDEKNVQDQITAEQLRGQLARARGEGAELTLRAKNSAAAGEELKARRRKELAELAEIEARARGDKIAILRAEADQDIAGFKKQFTNVDIRAKAILKREAQFEHERTKLVREEMLRRLAVIQTGELKAAQAQGDVRRVLQVQAQIDKRRALEAGLTGAELNEAVGTANQKARREFGVANAAVSGRVRQATMRGQEAFNDAADRRVSLEKRLQDIGRQTAEETRRFAKQKEDAEHDLNRALIDQLRLRQAINLSAAERAATAGAEQFVQSQFGTQLQNAEIRRGSRRSSFDIQASSAIARRTARQIAGSLASGDVEGAAGRLREAGVNVTGGDMATFRQFAGQNAEMEEQRIAMERRNAREGEKRQLEDAQRGIELGRQRITDLADQHREQVTALRESTRVLNDEWNNALRDSARVIAAATRSIMQAFADTRTGRLNIDPAIGNAAVGFMQQASQGNPLQSAPANIQININGQLSSANADQNTRDLVTQIWPYLGDFLQKQSRRTTPGK